MRAPAAPHELVKALSTPDLVLIGIGASIGAGIFVFTGVAAHKAGPGVALSFLGCAVVCALDALCYSDLATRHPQSGSAYLYARKEFGPAVASATAANLLFDYGVG
eukprot:SAG22_NODE_8559_length_645_cov_1.139194_1_plen_105_part_01